MVAIWGALAVSGAMVQFLRFAKKPFALLCCKLNERHIRPLLWLGFFLECAALSVLPLLVIYPISAAVVSILTIVFKERHGFNMCTALWALLALAPVGMPFVSDTSGYSPNNLPQMATILHRALTYPGNCYFGGCLALALIIERCASNSPRSKCIAGGLNFSFVSFALKTTVELVRLPAQNANGGNCVAVALIALCACVCRRAQMHPLRDALNKGEVSTASVVTLYGLVSALCACGTDVLIFAPRHIARSTLEGAPSSDGIHGVTVGLLALFTLGLTQLSRHAAAAQYATREHYDRVPKMEMNTMVAPIGAPGVASDDDFDEWMCAIENAEAPMLVSAAGNAASATKHLSPPGSGAPVKATTTKVAVDSFADFGALDSDPFVDDPFSMSTSAHTVIDPIPAPTDPAGNAAAPFHSSFSSSTSAVVAPFSPTTSLVPPFAVTTASPAARSPLSTTKDVAPLDADLKRTSAGVATQSAIPEPSDGPLVGFPESPAPHFITPVPTTPPCTRTPKPMPSDDIAARLAASTNTASGVSATVTTGTVATTGQGGAGTAVASLATPITSLGFADKMAKQGFAPSSNETFADFDFVNLPSATTRQPLSVSTNPRGTGATHPTAHPTATLGAPWNVVEDDEDDLFKSITDI